MANPTWGSTTMNVKFEGAAHPQTPPSGVLNEIPMLPDPTNISSPASILQTMGRKRFTIKLDAWVSSFSAYQNYYNDYINSTPRTFNGYGVSQSMYISDITNPVYTRPGFVDFTITFTEA